MLLPALSLACFVGLLSCLLPGPAAGCFWLWWLFGFRLCPVHCAGKDGPAFRACVVSHLLVPLRAVAGPASMVGCAVLVRGLPP